MASTINAVTTGGGGIAVGGDTSGVIALQKDGTTFATGNQYGIGLGTAVPSSGIGIAFPATQSASSDANTLDDYEEGTWTPVPTYSTGSLTTYTSSGVYVKTGRFVWITGDFAIVNKGTAANNLTITGAPFTASGASTAYRGAIGMCREDAAIGYGYQAYILKNGTNIELSNMTGSQPPIVNGYEFTFTICYEATA